VAFSLICKGCGAPRQPKRQLCDKCRDTRRVERKRAYDRSRKRPAEVVAEQQKRWYNKMAGDPARYEKKLAYKRDWNARHSRGTLVCASCGGPRGVRKWYCDDCRVAFRDYSQTAYEARRKRKGYKRDNSKTYQMRVAKYGREALALAAKVRYHLRKGVKDVQGKGNAR
jgi:hypothetical protein